MRHFFPFPGMESLETVAPNPKLNSVPPEMGQVSPESDKKAAEKWHLGKALAKPRSSHQASV